MHIHIYTHTFVSANIYIYIHPSKQTHKIIYSNYEYVQYVPFNHLVFNCGPYLVPQVTLAKHAPAKIERYVQRGVAISSAAQGGRTVGALCSHSCAAAWQVAGSGCRASGRHPWGVPGFHPTSSFPQATPSVSEKKRRDW